MPLELAAFFRTTLPLDLRALDELDDGRYHSIWMPDHLVSFWPDTIWTPDFTDLAEVSPSPHRRASKQRTNTTRRSGCRQWMKAV